ncbi:hypothetical protein HDU98_011501 [Podochytrium sp. JEL0797]|nr:hypothetical protein HDU98_011501 [Podochytrium sp. JEL0797]
MLPRDLGSLLSVTGSARALVRMHYPLFAESKFAETKLGNTHFWIKHAASPTAKRLVLLHGISGTFASMPQVVDRFVAKGFTVLCYDLYGRGYSAGPEAKYDPATYSNQLNELLEYVGWNKASLIGYSLGGGIATDFGDRFGHKVDDLVLVAPAGLRESLPLGGTLLTSPGLGSLFAATLGRRVLARISSNNHSPDFAHTPHMKHFIAVQDLNIKLNPGFLNAYVETVRNGPIRGMRSVYERVGHKFGDRVCCVWGRNDRVVSFAHDSPVFRRLNPRARFVEVEGGHSVLAEQCQVVVDPISEFLLRGE